MALTYAESFIRAYAERAVKDIEVTVDKQSGITLLSFYGREQRVNMRDLVLQEDAFRRLGNAVNALLGIPEQAAPTDSDEGLPVTQLHPVVSRDT
jgi:hypothetical protein